MIKQLSNITKLIFVFFLHFITFSTVSLFQLFETISFNVQFCTSLIHLVFMFLLFKLVILKAPLNKITKTVIFITTTIFLIANCIPFHQEAHLANNGFVEWWQQAEQTKLGWPVTFLRLYPFDDGMQNLNIDIGKSLFHWNNTFLNLYFLSLIIGLELAILQLIPRLKKQTSDS